MTAYPEPPETSGYPIPEDAVSQPISPPIASEDSRLPSKLWPWLVGLMAIVALGVQTWSLLGLLKASENESDFRAKVEAWEASNSNRQKAIAQWDQVELQANERVELLRKQAAMIQGTVESLQDQRDQLVQSTTTQNETIQTLQATRTSLEREVKLAAEELDAVVQKQKAAELAIDSADKTKERTEQQTAELLQRQTELKQAIADFEATSAQAKSEADTQQEVVRKNKAELAEVEGRLAQLDAFLQKKLASATELKIQQDKSAQIMAEVKEKAEQLQEQTSAVANVEAALAGLKQDIEMQEARRKQGELELTQLQANVSEAERRLQELRSKEQSLLDQTSKMTASLSSAATDASKSLSEISRTAAATILQMAEKATEVQNAVSQLSVPATDTTSTEDDETQGDQP